MQRLHHCAHTASVQNRNLFDMRAAALAILAVEILLMPGGLAKDAGRDTADVMAKGQPTIAPSMVFPVPKPTDMKLRRMWMRGGVLLVVRNRIEPSRIVPRRGWRAGSAVVNGRCIGAKERRRADLGERRV